MTTAVTEAGSFRDTKGRIFYVGDRVFRTVMPAGVDDFEFVRSTGIVEELVDDRLLIGEQRVDKSELGEAGQAASIVVEHPKLPFVSYPYEWSFSALKSAALTHLEIQQRALARGVAVSDATAYNIQFLGSSPLFIDSLSLRKYHDGEFWAAHRQFCEQFVNPLLLRSELGVPHNAWFRGALEGISTEDISKILPWRSRLSWNILTNVFMQARLQNSSKTSENAARAVKSRRLPKLGFDQMLHGLHRWISKLEPQKDAATVWQDYADDNSYIDDEKSQKHQFVAEFVADVKPKMLFDIGCNTGDYSIVALDAGATRVVGFDFDLGAIDHAFRRSRAGGYDLLPLHMDAANQSPSQGWQETERMGLRDRAHGDAVIALAVVHHLAIAKNLPLREVLDWIVDMAPQGVIEFVPKSDPMVGQLLSLREDIFDDYDEDSFKSMLSSRSRIVNSSRISASGRTLFWYQR